MKNKLNRNRFALNACCNYSNARRNCFKIVGIRTHEAFVWRVNAGNFVGGRNQPYLLNNGYIVINSTGLPIQ